MRRRPSPNFTARRGDARPDLVVLHATEMATAAAALQRLCAPEAQVSAHYLIAADGELWQLVAEDMRAWHAGAGAWGAVRDVNSRSIGVELANCGAEPFSEPQMAALEALLAALMARWPVPPERVIAHSDLAPARKRDPGPRFDWRRLAHRGLSVWPQTPAPAPSGDTAALHAHLARFGYPDGATGTLLAAFRSRFRPWAAGALDGWDVGLAADLARRFPVDRGADSA